MNPFPDGLKCCTLALAAEANLKTGLPVSLTSCPEESADYRDRLMPLLELGDMHECLYVLSLGGGCLCAQADVFSCISCMMYVNHERLIRHSAAVSTTSMPTLSCLLP
jgi:hypothetical protein